MMMDIYFLILFEYVIFSKIINVIVQNFALIRQLLYNNMEYMILDILKQLVK